MSSSSDPHDHTEWYEVRVQGHLDDRWAAWLDVVDLARTPEGTTVLRGRMADQSALHGLLHKLSDIGVRLVSVAAADAAAPRNAPHQDGEPT